MRLSLLPDLAVPIRFPFAPQGILKVRVPFAPPPSLRLRGSLGRRASWRWILPPFRGVLDGRNSPRQGAARAQIPGRLVRSRRHAPQPVRPRPGDRGGPAVPCGLGARKGVEGRTRRRSALGPRSFRSDAGNGCEGALRGEYPQDGAGRNVTKHPSGPPAWRRADWRKASPLRKGDPPRAGTRAGVGGAPAPGRDDRGGLRGSGDGDGARGAGCRDGRARSSLTRSRPGRGRRCGRSRRSSGSGDSGPAGRSRARPPSPPGRQARQPLGKRRKRATIRGGRAFAGHERGLVHLRARSAYSGSSLRFRGSLRDRGENGGAPRPGWPGGGSAPRRSAPDSAWRPRGPMGRLLIFWEASEETAREHTPPAISRRGVQFSSLSRDR